MNLKNKTRWIEVGLIACLAMVTTGCSDAKKRTESSDHLKHLARAVLKHQTDNQAWPDEIADLKPVIGQSDDLGPIGGDKDYAALISNPLTGANPGYEYVKPAEEPESYSSTIIFYQLRDGKRDETLPVAYLDGSVRPMGD